MKTLAKWWSALVLCGVTLSLIVVVCAKGMPRIVSEMTSDHAPISQCLTTDCASDQILCGRDCLASISSAAILAISPLFMALPVVLLLFWIAKWEERRVRRCLVFQPILQPQFCIRRE